MKNGRAMIIVSIGIRQVDRQLNEATLGTAIRGRAFGDHI
jgi:hypothetical protein